MSEQSSSKHRSPAYPAIGLKEAIAKARMIFERDGQAGSTQEAAFRHMGYSGAHGKSRTILSTLKKFGLTEEKNGRIMLTRDALLILLKDGNQEKKDTAIRRCALKPKLYKQLWDQYGEVGLPSNDTLTSELVADHGFNAKKVDEAVKAFRDTVEFAKLGEEPRGSEHSNDSHNGEDKHRENDRMPGWGEMGEEDMTPLNPENQSNKPVYRDYAIPRKQQRMAVLRLEYPVTQEDIDQIGKWLELMKDTIAE